MSDIDIHRYPHDDCLSVYITHLDSEILHALRKLVVISIIILICHRTGTHLKEFIIRCMHSFGVEYYLFDVLLFHNDYHGIVDLGLDVSWRENTLILV